jgi:DNA replication initiation complex subunit (GINS family)
LKIERQVRQEEKVHLETIAETCRQERIQLQEEIFAKKEEEKSKSTKLESLEKDHILMKENLNDLEKEKIARQAEEKIHAEEISFFQRQMDAVKLRFIEPKTN